MRHRLGLKEKEIASTMGISVGSVKTHTARGIAARHASRPAIGNPVRQGRVVERFERAAGLDEARVQAAIGG